MRFGPIPKGMVVCHTCDNRPCVRNDEPGIYVIRGIARPRYGHLWLGTDADNLADMADKGRNAKGAAVSIKLNPAKVREIRRLASAGSASQAELAVRFDVTEGHISDVVRGVYWPHV